MKGQLPGPGRIESIWLGIKSTRNYLIPIEFLFAKYGDYSGIRAPKGLVMLAFHPEAIEYVLKTNAKNYLKSADLDELKPVLGDGLLTSEGEHWKQHRRVIGPEFQHKNIEGFYPIFQRHLQALLEQWNRATEPFDVVPAVMQATYAIAGECFFGASIGDTAGHVHGAISYGSDFAVARMSLPFKPPIDWPLPSHQRFRRAIARVNEVVYGIIDQRTQNPRDSIDLLSRMLKNTSFTRQDLRDEVMTMLLAGHETTSNAIAWTLYLLSQHSQVQEQLRDELKQNVSAGIPTFEESKKLLYTKMVVEESLRLFPPAAVFARQNIQPDVIGGYEVPARSKINLCPWITHRHPGFWQEPERFNPERFARPPNPYAYFPFSHGPRECVGKGMAMAKAILIVAGIVKAFRLEFAGPPVVPRPLVTVRPHPGVTLRLTRAQD